MLYEKNVLFVDLDGTLVSTDALLESILIFLKANPLLIIFLFMWLLKGKAYFKDQLAQRVIPNPATLPYHRNVLEYIRQAIASGRTVFGVRAMWPQMDWMLRDTFAKLNT